MTIFTAKAPDLITNGYCVVPIGAGIKWPLLTQWQNLRMSTHEVPDYDRPGAGVGVICGMGLNPIVGVDIDSFDPALVSRFAQWCVSEFGAAPARIGNAPKSLLVYRAAEEHIPKMHSDVFSDVFGDKCQLEVLGHGNQFVAYHVHPATGREYRWVGGPGLDVVKASALPTVTPEQIAEMVRVFESMAVESGATRVAGAKGGGSRNGGQRIERGPLSEDDFFGRVNKAALEDLDAWVPALFPTARQSGEGYRVTQIDLGREHLEEPLSIQPNGIKDFGVWDQGDAREGGRTAIDLVIEWSSMSMETIGITGALGAANWLCQRLNTKREDFGFGLAKVKEMSAQLAALRDAEAQAKVTVDAAPDLIGLEVEVYPKLRDLLASLPALDKALFKIVSSRVKALGSNITPIEFKKAMRPLVEPTVNSKFPLTEFGNTDRLIDKHGKELMYIPETATWYVWDEDCWRSAVGAHTEVAHLAKETVRLLSKEQRLHEGSDEERQRFFEFCAASQRAHMVQSMLYLASISPKVVVPASQLDRTSWLLGVANGVVDLKTGVLMQAQREMRITLNTGVVYDPHAKCPVFEQTIKDVFYDDMEMVEFVMRTFGYALMGNPVEDLMFFPFGDGSNGKSTIFGAVRAAFGGYARSAEASSFVSDESKGGGSAGGPREDLVRLRGARFVYVNEPDEGSELREGMVKAMTGGDVITARAMFAKNSIDILPTWVAYMPTNHRPIIKGSDNGIWRRMGMIPFKRNFENDKTITKDEGRESKLRNELPGILTAIVRACLQYQRIGLKPPMEVTAARDMYRDQMDLLSEWIDECCVVSTDAMCEMRALWESWEGFAKRRGLFNYIRSSPALGRRLDKRFTQVKGTNGVRLRQGIKLKVSDDLFAEVF